MGLELAIVKVQELLVFGDSELIINQITERYATRDPKPIPYNKHLIDLCQIFKKIEFGQAEK